MDEFYYKLTDKSLIIWKYAGSENVSAHCSYVFKSHDRDGEIMLTNLSIKQEAIGKVR